MRNETTWGLLEGRAMGLTSRYEKGTSTESPNPKVITQDISQDRENSDKGEFTLVRNSLRNLQG